MQLTRIVLPVVLVLAAISQAEAGVCTLSLSTNGTLALSADGSRMGSDEPGGIGAALTILSVGSSTVTVASPTLLSYPAGHNGGSDVVEVAYRGTSVLSGVSQGFTSATTSFGVPNLLSAVLVGIDNRIRSSAGFSAGTYQTRTVVTCS